MSVNIKCDEITQHLDIFKQIFIRNVCASSDQVMSVPDFAFALEANPDKGRQLIKKLFAENNLDLYERVIVIVMNTYLCPGEATYARDHITFDKVCYDLAKIMDNTSASFVLLPFGNGFPHNDRLASSYLYTKCKFWKKVLLVYNKLSVQGTLDIISAANMMIGSRLHSSIFSCIGGTPFINLIHHDKISMFLQSINKDWGVNYWNFNTERLKFLMDDFLLNEQQYKEELLQISNKNRLFLLDLPNYLIDS